MQHRKPETFVLLFAIICTLAILGTFATDLLLTRERELESGDQRLQRFSRMMAEHTARSYEAIDVLLREMSADLSNNHRDWENWTPQQGWEYVAHHHSKSLPQLRDLALFDSDGNQRFISTYFPSPKFNAEQRNYFETLKNGAESTSDGPFIGGNSGRYTYALAHRINDGKNYFSGFVLAAIESGYLQDFCWANRISDDFEAVLINAKGQIVASCRPTDLSSQSSTIGQRATNILFDGKLKDAPLTNGTHTQEKIHVSIAPVPSIPDLQIMTAIPETTLLSGWTTRMVELGTLGGLVTLTLLFGGRYLRRQFIRMERMTDALEASHVTLAEKVQAATQELANEKTVAERANRAKSRFLAAASHDLRQPMHALSLFSADLLRQVRSGASFDQAHLAEQISSSAAALSQLLDSLLDISRLDVAGINPDIHPFPLNPIFERLNNSFVRAAHDRSQTLRFRSTAVWLNSDPVMIERILANLISNALRYTPVYGHVLVLARKRGEMIQLEVRDNGIGIAPEHQEAIFAEFYQVGNTAREQNQGLGLGLSIIERLTRALKLKIALVSSPNQGTTFSFKVEAATPFKTDQTLSPAKSNESIFCIGQSETLLLTVQLLTSWGYHIKHLASCPPLLPNGLILMDETEFIEQVQNIPTQARLILLMNSASLNLPENVHAMPIPVRPAKLRALIIQLQKTLAKSTE